MFSLIGESTECCDFPFVF